MKKLLLTTLAALLVATTFSQRTVYVDIDATGSDDGTSWANAYNDARDAFINANKGDNIWIAEGTYVRQNVTARNSTFGWQKDSVSVYGGFDGTETLLSQRDWNNNPTIFSGEIQGDNNITNNCYTVFTGPVGVSSLRINYALIDGITISDGYANATTFNQYKWGGGLYLAEYVKRLDIKNCTFKNNTAQGGAAIRISPLSENTEVHISTTKFEGNTASFASALWVNADQYWKPTVVVDNCLFTKNINRVTGGTNLGGVFYFSSNQAFAHSNVKLNNNTITQNSDSLSTTQKSIILLYQSSGSSNTFLNLRNNILYANGNFNNTTRYHPTSAYNFSAVNLYNCISEINTYATTNLSKVYTHDPLFIDSALGNFSLQATSPAIDSGTVVGLTLPVYDFAGKRRVNGVQVDLGCYEYHAPTVGITEKNNHTSLKLYPNPTHGKLTFESEDNIESIEIYSVSGQRVATFSHSNIIDISEFTPGMYVARIISGNKTSTKRIIKN